MKSNQIKSWLIIEEAKNINGPTTVGWTLPAHIPVFLKVIFIKLDVVFSVE